VWAPDAARSFGRDRSIGMVGEPSVHRIRAMRVVGRRTSDITLEPRPSAQAMRRGLAVVEAAATFAWATSTGQPKGVYRFGSFEAMERHRLDCLARAMADLAAARSA
jgi:hypothetical protein